MIVKTKRNLRPGTIGSADSARGHIYEKRILLIEQRVDRFVCTG